MVATVDLACTEERTGKTVSDNEFQKEFSIFSKELDEKNDKYERIVKISRDITIDSKRLIFSLLGRIRSDDFNKPSEKIEEDIKKIMRHFKKIVCELENEEPYQFINAYTAGLEEFIEALTLYKFMTTSNLFGVEEVRGMFDEEFPNCSKQALIPVANYLLGVQDLTGELMRLCISGLSARKLDLAIGATEFVKWLYMAMLQLSFYSRDFPKKLFVLKQSLLKMEHAVYTIGIRGSEMPSHMIESIISTSTNEALYES